MASNELLEIIIRLAAAIAAGGLIGLERSYHGRPAGFRTHTLVCLSSALPDRLQSESSVVEFSITPVGA